MLVVSRLHNSYVAPSSLDLADHPALQPLARLLVAARKAVRDMPLVLVGAAARAYSTPGTGGAGLRQLPGDGAGGPEASGP